MHVVRIYSCHRRGASFKLPATRQLMMLRELGKPPNGLHMSGRTLPAERCHLRHLLFQPIVVAIIEFPLAREEEVRSVKLYHELSLDFTTSRVITRLHNITSYHSASQHHELSLSRCIHTNPNITRTKQPNKTVELCCDSPRRRPARFDQRFECELVPTCGSFINNRVSRR